MNQLQSALKKEKILVMLAPSFACEFDYPEIISELKQIGFDKVVELTFGAKMINREYHNILESDKNKLWISSVCPGIVEFVKLKYPQYTECLMPVDSPMIATAKICRKFYPSHRICFIYPCNFKKHEAEKSKIVDYCIDYQELKELLKEEKIKNIGKHKVNCGFDRFYNDFTKIYPLSGGLSKTAHLKQVLKKGCEKVIDGLFNVEKFLDEHKKGMHKNIKFLDVTFCKGGCLGGPFLSSKNLEEKKKRLKKYMNAAEKEKIPKGREGLVKEAEGISFLKKN